ncbi:2-oxoglutarate and iron-dependent oxygenase domain-containing protein [Microbulbifer bruguierae]|uniref:2-oxoglutarate-dependent ethylene/succinate-forming enzyme n=1 Tax=Microbulbifer bruguierae TaxID=3029061 RepID=A0ABY8NI26_9GAMM|nr:2-oxoglutarate and iron-dependent oxygenase domain-containing protein [Microbulbifer bruguierae]WGL17193.1 2-oxoglutarate and iron-dependent oxygenase domain-containing protein [Microbulbifer bruguierae]
MTAGKPASIDLSRFFDPAQRDQFCRQLLDSLSEFGFVIIRNHGIPISEFERAYQLCTDFFALPLENKRKYESGNGQRGYIGLGKETAAGQSIGDLKEYWHIGPNAAVVQHHGENYPENTWPGEIPEFEPFFTGLHQKLESVAGHLAEALALAVGLEQDHFKNMIAGGNSVQRLIHYPALRDVHSPGAVRAAAHTDINLMTLLIGATDSGLELLDRHGNWLPVEHRSDEIVVDTGDMMARLTNNYLPATTHRVVNPRTADRPRFSIPYFVHPRNSVSLECLPQYRDLAPLQPPITAGEFLTQRLRENGF